MVTAVVLPRLAGIVGVADSASVTHLIIAVTGTVGSVGDAGQSVQGVVVDCVGLSIEVSTSRAIVGIAFVLTTWQGTAAYWAQSKTQRMESPLRRSRNRWQTSPHFLVVLVRPVHYQWNSFP